MVDFVNLSAPFPRDAVSWRAQHFTSDGKKALALAYIDARDVMNRLDDVCGVDGWQCEYPHANSKTICSIGVRCGNEWIWKADGAGDTDIEAEKGAISDAFKRAAVKWGIGRYLYALEAPWVECEATKNEKGKWVLKKWTIDPWKKVKPEQKAGFETYKQQNAKWETIRDELVAYVCEPDADEAGLRKIWAKYEIELGLFKRQDAEVYRQLEQVKNDCKSELLLRAGMPQDFNSAK